MSKQVTVNPYNIQYDRGYQAPLDASSYMGIDQFNSELSSYNTNFYRGHIVSVDEGSIGYVSPKVIERVKSSDANAAYTNVVVSKEAESIIVENDLSVEHTIPNSLYFVLGGSIATDAVQWGYVSCYTGDPDITHQTDLYGSATVDAPTLAYNYALATEYSEKVNSLYKRFSGAARHNSIHNIPCDKGRVIVTDITGTMVASEFNNYVGNVTFSKDSMILGDEVHWIACNTTSYTLTLQFPQSGDYYCTNSNQAELAPGTICEGNFLKADKIYVRVIGPDPDAVTISNKGSDVLAILPNTTDAYIPEINVAAVLDNAINSVQAPAPTATISGVGDEPWGGGVAFWGQIIGNISKQSDLYSSNNFSLLPVYTLLKESVDKYNTFMSYSSGVVQLADNSVQIPVGDGHTSVVHYTISTPKNITLSNPNMIIGTGFDVHVILVNDTNDNITFNMPTSSPYCCIGTNSIVIGKNDAGEINFVGADAVYVRSVGD